MYPQPMLKDVPEGANVLILNVQYVRSKKLPDGGYSDDCLYIVYRDLDTGKKRLQIIKNPKTDIYVTKPEYMNDWKTPREAVLFEKVDRHTVTYRERESYLYKLLQNNLLSEEDQLVKRTIDHAKEVGKWGGRKEIHKWRNAYFSDYDISDYVYMTANLHYKPDAAYKPTKSFLDIETDIFGRSRLDHETGKCPINATTIIFDFIPDGSKLTKPQVFTLLLRDHKRYPQQPYFEEHLDEFIKTAHEEFDKKYGDADYHILMFDSDDELLLTIFKLQHTFKPDFTGIFNMSYDIPYIGNRADRLGMPKEVLFSHPDFGDAMYFYQLDQRYQSDFKNRGDAFNCLSYTKYTDQMLNYAARRKGGQDYGSSTLDNIAHIELKSEKRRYDRAGVTVINAAIEEYWNFVLYSLNDVWLQVGLERKTGDIDDLFYKGYDSGTRLDKANRQTVSLKNLWCVGHFEHGYVMGNNLNVNYADFGEADDAVIEESDSGYDETLKGALVGHPTAINNVGVKLFGNERSNRIFKDCIDLDATSMYPSINLVNNISRSSQHGRLIILNKVSPLEYSVNPHLRGGEFVDDYETRDYIKVGVKWFSLKRTEEYIREFFEYRKSNRRRIVPKAKHLGGFFKLWYGKMEKVFSLIYPEDRSRFKAFFKYVFNRDVKNVDCTLYNNYENVEYDTTLLDIVDWILEVKPIMTESGTFFKRHEEGPISPGLLITDGLIKKRKALKKVELEHESLGNKEQARLYNLKQNRVKIFTNSAYGVSGARTSAFYSYHTAQSTTSKGQTYISLAMTTFEDFLGDTIQFYDFDELLHYCENIIAEKVTYDDYEILAEQKTIKQVRERLLRKCKNIKKLDVSILDEILENVPQTALNRLYYKSNLVDFVQENPYVHNLIYTFSVNAPSFMDPNSPPHEGKKYLKKMTEIILEYCQYNYPYYGRVDRLINTKRNNVIVIDTDSNIITVHDIMTMLVSYMEKPKATEIYAVSRGNRTKEAHRLKAMNTVAFILTEVITRALDKFKVDTNVENHPLGVYQMKNEFGMPALLLASGKKRYLSSIILREGKYLYPPKKDIKGFDFKKVSFGPKYVRESIENILFKYIVTDNINIQKALKELMDLEDKVRKEIRTGNKEFLTESKVKTIDSYADPMGAGSFKATYVWNSLYPDKEISLPNNIHTVKVNIKSAKDVAMLALDHRDAFERITEVLKDPKLKTGITQIAIPLDEEVPDWILALMDVETMVNKNMALVTPILEEIGVRPVYRKKSEQYLSNIISIG